MLESRYVELCPVALPYAGRQRYMWGFDTADPVMEPGFEDYLVPVVRLLAASGACEGRAWMTVDEKIVRAGCSQRRPGPHVDGRFDVKAQSWSEGGGGGGGGGWKHTGPRTPIIVAASEPGCRAWRGLFDATPTDKGDLSHAAELFDEGEILRPNVGYLLSGDCVHESLIVERDTPRTFLRIAVPFMAGR